MDGRIGISSILTLVFVVLKLTHAINWSWWWVLSPTLITIGLVVLILLIGILAAYMAEK